VFLIPPRSLLRLRLTDVRLEAHGLAGTAPLPPDLASAPTVRERSPGAAAPARLDEVVSALRGAARFDPDPPADEIAPRARALLVEAADAPRPVQDAARRLGVAPETVSRKFRAAYGLTPKKYLHRLRVSDAVLALLAGRGVLAAGFDAGFGDAGRFYDLFGRATGNTPGQYASLADQKSRGRTAAPRRR
jgi:AraC-like DNA-binding protein